MPRYQITNPPHYRDGKLYQEGDVIELPPEIKPPKSAILLDGKLASPTPPKPTQLEVDTRPKARASDKSPV